TSADSTLGNRSELASQHAVGGPSSPLDWLAEEVRRLHRTDAEQGRTSFEAGANTGGLSSISAASSGTNSHYHTYSNSRGNATTTATITTTTATTTTTTTTARNNSHLFGRTLTRTTTSSPLPERFGGAEGAPPDQIETRAAGDDATRGPGSPAASLTPVHRPWADLPRPPQAQHQKQERRPPPTPWAPWRRQPAEHSIAPVTSSPAESRFNDSGPVRAAGAAAAAAAMAAAAGRGPYFAARAVPSAGSLESLVMFLPPSPATP
ncbi:unnamed protein product, partial [Hapterophycus canaliculatus]